MMASKGVGRRLKCQYKKQMKFLQSTSMVLGCLSMTFIWMGLLLHNTGAVSGYMDLQNHPEKYFTDGEMSESRAYFDKYHMWIANLAGALILLTGLFAMAVKHWLPIDKYCKFTAFLHLVGAIILGISVIFVFLYVTNVYQATCGENGYVTRMNNEIKAMNNNQTGKDWVKWSEFKCPTAVFLYTTSISTRLTADDKDWPGDVGFMTFFFVLAVLSALCHGVQCIRIFLLRSNRKIVDEAPTPTKGKKNGDSVSFSCQSSFDSGL